MSLPRVAPAAVLALALLTTGCDQLTKRLMRGYFAAHGPASFLSGAVTLVPAENPGAFLGMGSSLSAGARTLLFVSITGLALAAGGWYLLRRRHRADVAIAGALLVGGGLGNLIDRVTRGGLVSDFLLLRAGPLHTGVFNLADVAITAGAILLAATSLFPPREGAATDL